MSSFDESESDKQPHNLEQMLDRLKESSEKEGKVSIEAMMEAVGRRSFGPLILVVGLISMSPLSGIPTLPSIMGIMVALIAGQLLFGRDHFWLPQKILKRTIDHEKLCKALKKLRPGARFIDRFIHPRLCFMTQDLGGYVIAGICVVIGLTMPPLEILPFLATTAGFALTVFGLALIAHDGALAIAGVVMSVGVIGYAVVKGFGAV